jgi:hypothetical protein
MRAAADPHGLDDQSGTTVSLTSRKYSLLGIELTAMRVTRNDVARLLPVSDDSKLGVIRTVLALVFTTQRSQTSG